MTCRTKVNNLDLRRLKPEQHRVGIIDEQRKDKENEEADWGRRNKWMFFYEVAVGVPSKRVDSRFQENILRLQIAMD